MAILSRPAFGPRTSLAYITAGTLMDVWTTVWYFAFIKGSDQPMSNNTWFWVVGLFLTGITLIVIGALLGPIGQAARRAELPPSEALSAEARIQQTGAAHPNPVAAGAVGAAPMAPAAAGYYPQPVAPGPVPAPAAPAAPPAGAVQYGS